MWTIPGGWVQDLEFSIDFKYENGDTNCAVRKYGKTVDIQIIYGQFIVMSKDCRESNVQRASFMLKVESGDSGKLSLSSGTKYSSQPALTLRKSLTTASRYEMKIKVNEML